MTNPNTQEPMTNTDEVVEQSDRDAAAAIVRSGAPGLGNGNKVVGDDIKGGLHDDYLIVKAFAAHRIEALSTRPLQVPTPEMIEAGAKAVADQLHYKSNAFDRCVEDEFKDDYRNAAKHAYTAMSQKAAPAAPSEEADIEAKVMSYDHAHEDAVAMGYPSLTEALEHLSELLATAPSERAATRIAELEKRIRKAKRELKRDRFEARDRIAYALAALAAPPQKAA